MCMNYMDKTQIYDETGAFKALGDEKLDDNLILISNKVKKESKQIPNFDYASIICNFLISDKSLIEKNQKHCEEITQEESFVFKLVINIIKESKFDQNQANKLLDGKSDDE